MYDRIAPAKYGQRINEKDRPPWNEKIRAKVRAPYGSNPGRAREYPEDDCGESAGRIRNHRQAVDIGTDAGIYPEGIPQNHQRADAVGLHETLGHELPAPVEACAETEPKHKDKIDMFFLPPYAPEYNPDESPEKFV